MSAAMLGLLSLVLSSCINVEFRSDFGRDGNARHTLAIVVPRDEFDAAVTAGTLAAWDELAANAAEAGLQPERIDDEENVTFQVSIERPDGEDAGAALNSLLNATGLNTSPGISAPFQGSFEQRGSAVGGSDFVLDMTADGALLVDALTSSDLASDIDPATIDDIELTYRVDSPGSLRSTTGREVDSDTLLWDIDKASITEIKAESSAGGAGSAALFIVAAIASIAGALLLAGFVGWMLARRPALASSIGESARHFPRRTTLTSEGLWVAYRVRMLVERIWRRSAPHGETPVQHELLESAEERDDDGTDAEGDRPAAGVHGG